MRNRQHLTAVQELKGGLCLTTLRFAEDLVEPSFIADLKPSRADAREMKLALQLIEGLSREWDPQRHRDAYTANLLRVIKAKSKGTTPRRQTDDRKVAANVVNLMERLKESLEATRGGTKEATAVKRPPSSKAPHRKRKRAA